MVGIVSAFALSFYICLKTLRKKNFEEYLKSEDLHLKHTKAAKWMTSSASIPYEIDYEATRSNFKKTKFWNWEFRGMVETRKLE